MRPVVNRLARIERGRRHQDRRGANLTPGVTSSEMRTRSEERTVAKWFDDTDEALDAVVAGLIGGRRLVRESVPAVSFPAGC